MATRELALRLELGGDQGSSWSTTGLEDVREGGAGGTVFQTGATWKGTQFGEPQGVLCFRGWGSLPREESGQGERQGSATTQLCGRGQIPSLTGPGISICERTGP